MNALKLRLDYFRIYDVSDLEAAERIRTLGQFDQVARPGKIGVLDLFGICTSKNAEPLFQKDALLTWHHLSQAGEEPVRVVNVNNQFGKGKLWIRKVEGLLCPTLKADGGREAPGPSDHYKVYRVLDFDRIPNKAVLLKDEFLSEKVNVQEPVYFAVPVTKRVGRKENRIVNPRTHLVVYRTAPIVRRPRIPIQIVVNQFGRWRLMVGPAVNLAVPSLKTSWK